MQNNFTVTVLGKRYIKLDSACFTISSKPLKIDILDTIAGRTLYYFYDKPSKEKLASYNYTLRLCNRINGRHFGVVSANTYNFTMAFLVTVNNQDYIAYMSNRGNFLHPLIY